MDEVRKYAIANFNPLPPCGGRPVISMMFPPSTDFNPLPPCGGRHLSEPTSQKQGHFNPLPPCGGRLCDR